MITTGVDHRAVAWKLQLPKEKRRKTGKKKRADTKLKSSKWKPKETNEYHGKLQEHCGQMTCNDKIETRIRGIEAALLQSAEECAKVQEQREMRLEEHKKTLRGQIGQRKRNEKQDKCQTKICSKKSRKRKEL